MSMMKQIQLVFLIIAAILIAACHDDSDPEIVVSTFVTNGMQPAGTRAAADIQNSSFDKDEQFNLYIVDNLNNSTKIADNVANATGTNVGTGYYYPANGHNVDIYGIYPQSVKYGDTSFSVSTTQTMDAAGRTNYKNSDLMSAKVLNALRQEAAQTLQFTHQLSKVIVSIKRDASLADTETATLTLNSARTDATIANGVFSAVTGSPADISLGTVTLSSATVYQSLAAIIPPQTIPASGSEATDFITITLGSGGSFTYQIPSGSPKAFAGGNAYTYTITVGLKEISVTTAITDWNAPDGNTTAIGGITI